MKNGILLLGALALAGCVMRQNTGNPRILEVAVRDQVKAGESTKDQVEELLGSPAEIDLQQGGWHQWLYEYIESSVQAYSNRPGGARSCFSVLFGPDGIVADSAFTHVTLFAAPEPRKKPYSNVDND